MLRMEDPKDVATSQQFEVVAADSKPATFCEFSSPCLKKVLFLDGSHRNYSSALTPARHSVVYIGVDFAAELACNIRRVLPPEHS